MKKALQLIGLMSALSYMIIILATWILTASAGYIYFSAGEPNLWIRNLEWVLGFLGMFALIETIKTKIKE